jgi:hypothetical protein
MPRKDPEGCAIIRDRVDKWEKYWTINRALYYEWIDFVMGDQWREDESKLFERYNKIPLMFNKLGILMNNLLADMIQNTPNLQILPDENVPVKTAEIRAALIRQISLNSDAKVVYQNAYWQAIVGGYGAFMIMPEYLNDDTFDQEPRITSIDDPNRCYWSIDAKTKSKTDGMYAGFRIRMSRKRFRDIYGEEVEGQIGSSSVTEDSTLAFADDDSITIVHDFERKPEKLVIRKLSDESIVDEVEFKKLRKETIDGKRYIIKDGEPVTVLDKREVTKFNVIHKEIAGDFVLDETEFPSESLPVIFVDQKSYYTKQGQQITRSFFKDVKDAQKFLNYLATQTAYMMKISRYDQFIAPRKALANPDTQQIWRDPSVVQGALIYDETPSGAKPEQLRPPEISQSFTILYERTLMDIQSGTGMYNSQMGEEDNAISGRAIAGRAKRGTKNTYVSRDSIDQAITMAGIIIDEMIPKLYDTKRMLMLTMPDSENMPVMINQAADQYGMEIMNDMTKGRYRIRLRPGPSYEGQKEEALESLQSVIGADKSGTVFPMVADLYAENLPIDNNLELRNRLRTMVPPEIIQAGKTGQPLPPKQNGPSPEQIMIQLKQQELQIAAQKMQSEAAAKMKELEIKQSELQRKAIESHQDITMQWEKLQSDKEEAAAQLQEAMLRYQAEGQRIGADLQINHSQNLIKLLTHTPKHLENRAR